MYMYSKLFSGYDLVWCIPNISQPYCQDTKWSVSVWRLKSFVPGLSAANLRWPENIHGDLVIWGVNLDAYPGWWLTYPSEKYESQLGWWHSIYIWKKIQTTNQYHIHGGMIWVWRGEVFKKARKTPGDSSGASLDANTLPPSTLLRFILLALLSRKRPGVGRRHSWSDLSQLYMHVIPLTHQNGTCFTCLSQSYHAMSAVAVVISESQAFVGCKKRTH